MNFTNVEAFSILGCKFMNDIPSLIRIVFIIIERIFEIVLLCPEDCTVNTITRVFLLVRVYFNLCVCFNLCACILICVRVFKFFVQPVMRACISELDWLKLGI